MVVILRIKISQDISTPFNRYKLATMVWHPLEIHVEFLDSMIDTIQHGPFWICSKYFVYLLVPKIRYTYFTMMELGTAYSSQENSETSYETLFELCWYQHFSPEISKFCYIWEWEIKITFQRLTWNLLDFYSVFEDCFNQHVCNLGDVSKTGISRSPNSNCIFTISNYKCLWPHNIYFWHYKHEFYHLYQIVL